MDLSDCAKDLFVEAIASHIHGADKEDE